MGRLTDIFFALSNPNRIKIYNLVLKERMNITQISEAISMSYKSTLNNLNIFLTSLTSIVLSPIEFGSKFW